MCPLLVCTISSLGGTEGKDGCEDCSLTVGCSLADSLLIGMSGIMSNSSPEVVGDTISWRRFRLSVPCDVCTVYDLGATSDKTFPAHLLQGIHSMSPCSSGGKLRALCRLSKFSFCFSRLVASIISILEQSGILGFSSCSIVGKLLLNLQFIRSSAGLQPMVGIGVVLYDKRARYRSSDFFSSCFTVCTPRSASPFDCGKWGLLVVCLKEYCLEN